MHTGERQAAKMRLAYLRAMLDQDIAVFDTEASTGEVINAITSDILVVQDAISEKVRTRTRKPHSPARVTIPAAPRPAAGRRAQASRKGKRTRGINGRAAGGGCADLIGGRRGVTRGVGEGHSRRARAQRSSTPQGFTVRNRKVPRRFIRGC